MQEAGELSLHILPATDARSVFDAVAARDICEPAEGSLKLHLLALRDKVIRGVVKRLFWTDTRDMLADGLTKGSVDRDALHSAMTGSAVVSHQSTCKFWRPKHLLKSTSPSQQKSAWGGAFVEECE